MNITAQRLESAWPSTWAGAPPLDEELSEAPALAPGPGISEITTTPNNTIISKQ